MWLIQACGTAQKHPELSVNAQNKLELARWGPLLLGVPLRALKGGSYDLMAKNMNEA